MSLIASLGNSYTPYCSVASHFGRQFPIDDMLTGRIAAAADRARPPGGAGAPGGAAAADRALVPISAPAFAMGTSICSSAAADSSVGNWRRKWFVL